MEKGAPGRGAVKLIFNPFAATAKRLKLKAEDITVELRALGLRPEVCIVEQGLDVAACAREALERGFRLFAVCGGDGTVSAAAGELAGGKATLAVVPTGSQNNMAMSLGIPTDLHEAITLIKAGRRVRVDVGEAVCAGKTARFLETCSVGLVSALSASGEAIQHGDLTGVGEFLGRLISSEPADMELVLDGKRRVSGRGHIALASNMPTIGFHYRVGPAALGSDGKLDILFFEGLSKLDLLAFAARGVHIEQPDDERIQKFRVSSIEIEAKPPMPVMADGRALGDSPVRIGVMRRALSVFAPRQ